MEPAEQGYLKKSIETLLAWIGAVRRFYPAQLSYKERKEEADGGGDKGKGQEAPVEQIWIVKTDRSETGQKIYNILNSMQEDGHLKDLMDAGIREDRAPKGSMVRALESILKKK